MFAADRFRSRRYWAAVATDYDDDGCIGERSALRSGLALYNEDGDIIGAIGVSETGDDNIIFDIAPDPETGNLTSAGGYGHPECAADTTRIARELPETHPIGEARQSGTTGR